MFKNEDLSQWPWATLLAVGASIVLGITSVVDGDALNYSELSTMLVITWSALALGRGWRRSMMMLIGQRLDQ
jgi:hypothetical protein